MTHPSYAELIEQQMYAPIYKPCSRCCEIKPLDAFGLDRNRKDGHTYECRTCRIEIDRARLQQRKHARALRRAS